MTYAATVTQKGQVTIPAQIRRRLNVRPYQKVNFVEKEDTFYIEPHRDFLSLKGSIKSKIKYSDFMADKKVLKYIANEYKKKTLVDTNVILRFLLNDNPNQAQEAEDLFEKAENNQLEIPDIIIAELIFVLLSVYKLSRRDIVEKIRAVVEHPKFMVNKKIINFALDEFLSKNVSFVDGYLVALAKTRRGIDLFTFDKKLMNVLKK